MTSESLFLGMDIVQRQDEKANLEGSFALGSRGSVSVQKSIIDRTQGKYIEEMKEWRNLPLLLVPVQWSVMFA